VVDHHSGRLVWAAAGRDRPRRRSRTRGLWGFLAHVLGARGRAESGGRALGSVASPCHGVVAR
jgi:hypothetical protein